MIDTNYLSSAQFSDDLIELMRLRDVSINGNITEQRVAGRGRRTVHRWRRLGAVGRGSYSTVFKETNEADGSLRAVKQIEKDRHGLYKREIGALTMFTRRPDAQDVFVAFHGWYETDATVCLVQEYLEHGDLGRWMHRPLPEVEAREIARQLLEGLHILHEANFVHRDIKPGNILVASVSPWHVKIGDFGTGRRLLDEASNRNTFVGTIAYQAPEYYSYNSSPIPSSSAQATSDNVALAVDIWSLGCIVFELLSGSQPFHGQLIELKQYCDGAVPFPIDRLQQRNVSGAASVMLEALLAPNPSNRFTADGALNAAWFDDEPQGVREPDGLGVSPSYDQSVVDGNQQLDREQETTPPGIEGDGIGIDSDGFEQTIRDTSPATTLTRLSLDEDEAPLIRDDSASIISRSSTWSRGSTIIAGIPPPLEAVTVEMRRYSQTSRNYLYRVMSDLISGVPSSRLQGLGRSRHGLEAIAEMLLSPSLVDVTPGILLQAIFKAVKDGAQDAVRMLVAMGADVNAPKPDAPHRGDTTLIMSTWLVDQGMMDCLLNLGADPNLQSVFKGHTALFCAAARGQEYMMRKLLSVGADARAATPDGWTALHLAAQEGRLSVIKVLLEHRADVNAPTSSGLRPIHCAAQGGHSDVANRLLAARARPNVSTSEGLTPLHLAARHGDEKTARQLLGHGASARVHNEADRQTPLHMAAACGHDKVVKALLTYHAETEARDKLGKTAMHYAAVCNRAEPVNMIRMLYLHGARCSVRDGLGATPAMVADWPEVKRELIAFARQQQKKLDGVDEEMLVLEEVEGMMLLQQQQQQQEGGGPASGRVRAAIQRFR